MSAADFLDDAYPHGTVEGFRGGCRTNRLCATADSWLSCAAVNTRYASDWVFRKRVDAKATVAELMAFDAAEAAEKRQAEKDANRRIRDALKREEKARRPRQPKGKQVASHHAWSDEEIAELRRLHALNWHDKPIGEALGRSTRAIYQKRTDLELPAHKRVYGIQHGTVSGYSHHGCRGDDCPATPSCATVGRAYKTERKLIGITPRTPAVHGTRAMYQKGCRRPQEHECPEYLAGRMSCAEANRESSTEHARKRAREKANA